jgi:2-hydroxychromene-2-carboxylate isomerase
MNSGAASPNAPSRAIEFWFDFGSNYSYLSVMRVEAEAAARDIAIRWRPFLLGPVFRELGFENSPFVLQKQKGAYVWKDMERQCRKYGIALARPSVFPRAALLAMRVALIGAEREWIGAYCRDIGSPEVVSEALSKLGLPAQQIIGEALTDANKLRLRQQTETASAKGIFGAPTFFCGDEMFWGNDRLEDALDFCYSSPC